MPLLQIAALMILSTRTALEHSSVASGYQDADLNGIPEQVTETITVNNRTTTLLSGVSQAVIRNSLLRFFG
jgi:hypothetical protein